jgi:hypothetical protein
MLIFITISTEEKQIFQLKKLVVSVKLLFLKKLPQINQLIPSPSQSRILRKSQTTLRKDSVDGNLQDELHCQRTTGQGKVKL